jgi:hypothetical protein
MLRKEGIWPALVIGTTPSPFPFAPLAQDAAQTHTNPPIDIYECRSIGVFKVLEPAAYGHF